MKLTPSFLRLAAGLAAWAGAARAETLWNWVPNEEPIPEVPDPVGAWVAVPRLTHEDILPIDLNGDGRDDFHLRAAQEGVAVVSVVPLGENQILGYPAGPFDLDYFAAALAVGATVGEAAPAGTQWRNRIDTRFGPIGGTLFGSSLDAGHPYGYFANQRGFAGVRFQALDGQWHYGALELEGIDTGFIAGVLYRTGWNTVPGAGIEIVPEPAARGLLLLGAAAALAVRRRTPQRGRSCPGDEGVRMSGT
jgi:hypothetical protein